MELQAQRLEIKFERVGIQPQAQNTQICSNNNKEITAKNKTIVNHKYKHQTIFNTMFFGDEVKTF
jgi:hypothetical protein